MVETMKARKYNIARTAASELALPATCGSLA
jgi:hypothetical protein